jgi:VWFA-related protein
MRSTPTAFLLGLLLLLSGTGLAEQGRPTTVDRGPAPTFTSGVDMVTISVSVRDRQGRIVRGLGPSDFRLIDSGFGRAIDSVLPSNAPLRVAILVDVSGSMAVDHNIDRAWNAVRTIVESLHSGRDEAALYTFDTVLLEVVPFTTDLDRFAAVTQTGKPYGKTSLYDAVADTATLVGRYGSSHRALLVVTDGVDNGSRRTPEEVSRVANEISVPVHLLTVSGPLDRRDGPGGSAGTDSAALTATLGDLARWTGGSVQATSTEDDLREALDEVLQGLRFQYVVTFKPGFRRGWHPIRIRMADNDWAVQARRGYVAGRARLN